MRKRREKCYINRKKKRAKRTGGGEKREREKRKISTPYTKLVALPEMKA
jgi:hypothetical protein